MTNQEPVFAIENLNFYYVGLFLVDEQNEWAALQAGTGEAGQIMLTLPDVRIYPICPK